MHEFRDFLKKYQRETPTDEETKNMILENEKTTIDENDDGDAEAYIIIQIIRREW